jgi:UDP-glucuronate decarboxylase
MATEKSVSGPINLGNPHEITIRELAERVIDMTGAKSKLIFKDLPADDPLQRKPDITKAQTILNWNPTVALETGLASTIDYFRDLVKNRS